MMDAEQSDMPRTRDDESGLYTERYPVEQFRDALAGIAPATTSDVAGEIGCAYPTAYQKLRILEDDGEITSERVGNVRVWSVPDNEEGDE